MCCRQRLLKAQPVKAGWRRGCRPGCLPLYPPATAIFLQVRKPCRTLNIGECFRDRLLERCERLPTCQRPFELPRQRLKMRLRNAIQVQQLAVDSLMLSRCAEGAGSTAPPHPQTLRHSSHAPDSAPSVGRRDGAGHRSKQSSDMPFGKPR